MTIRHKAALSRTCHPQQHATPVSSSPLVAMIIRDRVFEDMCYQVYTVGDNGQQRYHGCTDLSCQTVAK